MFLRHTIALAYALVAVAAVAIYVFKFTPYENFLFSDMQGFWRRAMDRYNGKEFIESQFVAWPPLYHVFLAKLFELFRAMGHESWVRLESVLGINIAAFGVSVYAFYHIASTWFDRRLFVHLGTALYAFGFPSFYFHAFLLSENLTVPLVLVAVACVVCGRGWASVCVGAVAFGLAGILRPAFAPFGLAFIGLFLLRYRWSWPFIGRAAVFTGVFFIVVFIGMAEVVRISKGKVIGLSANGGLDFFIAQSHYHRVDLNYDGWHFFVVVPAYSLKPRNGFYSTTTPFYKQDEYFRMGWQHLRHNPIRLLQNVEHVKNLFLARMLPSRNDAPGFKQIMPVFRWLKIALLASLGLYFWLWKRLGERQPTAILLLAMIGLTMFLSYWFTGEPRYTYAIMFAFYLLGLKTVEWLFGQGRRAWRILGLYGIILASGIGATAATVHQLLPHYPPTVVCSVGSGQPLTESVASPPQTFTAGWIHFRYQETGVLRHWDVEHVPLSQPCEMRFNTTLTVDQTRSITLEFCSGYPVTLFHNGAQVFADFAGNYFQLASYPMTLEPGVHYFELHVSYTGQRGGLSLYYSYMEHDWCHRIPFGVSSSVGTFSLPSESSENQAEVPQ
ncbi:MAG: hypothetical protein SFY80_15425 [Verrucomicrobiota bacterium]|nr:hypothetical protein [Verrucomicrobiota bacterium]